MSKRPKRRLYARMNSFGWREGWQNIVVFYAPVLIALLGILAVYAVPSLFRQGVPWTEGDRLTGTIVGVAEEPTRTCTRAALIVELDTGAVVQVCNSEQISTETGLRVVVQEYVLEDFDRRKYRIIRVEGREPGPE